MAATPDGSDASSVTVAAVLRHALPIEAVLSVVTGGLVSGALTVKLLALLVPELPATSLCAAEAEYEPAAKEADDDQAPATHSAVSELVELPVIAIPTDPSPVVHAPAKVTFELKIAAPLVGWLTVTTGGVASTTKLFVALVPVLWPTV